MTIFRDIYPRAVYMSGISVLLLRCFCDLYLVYK